MSRLRARRCSVMGQASAPSAGGGNRRLTLLVQISLVLGAVLVIAVHGYSEVRALYLSEPMGMWETTYESIARVWPHEYQLGNYVAGHDSYGPGYPAFCRPFLGLFADGYFAHRAANLFAICAACAALVCILHACRCSVPIIAATTAIVYALNEGTYSIQARPDFLVTFEVLLMLGIGRPSFRKRCSPFWLGLLLGLLALVGYLTKPYAILAWAIVLGHIALAGRWRRTVVVAGLSAATLGCGLWAYAVSNPYYFFESFTGLRAVTDLNRGWFVMQVRDFSVLACGLIAIAAPAGAQLLRHLKHAHKCDAPGAMGSANGVDDVGYWGWAIIVGLLALILGPGWHRGAYLTYFLHLLLPQLAVFAAIACGPSIRWPWREVALMGNLAVLLVLAPQAPVPDPGWNALARDLLQQPGHVVVDFIMEPLVRQRANTTTLGDGMTAFALAEPLLIIPPTSISSTALAETREYEAAIEREVLGPRRPEAIYLEVLFQTGSAPDEPTKTIPRGGLAYLLSGLATEYHVSKVFTIHPYQLSTNTARQFTGSWQSNVLKLVRKER
jgi:hypothetical protein